ncbi:MAG TPA: PAS domain-containing protein, partial [Ideonella sp.]|nr:PAS domain-containing protein [Ideonella sp.]
MGLRAAASAPAAGLRGFLLGLADPVLVLGAGAQVVFANEAARRVLGDLPALPAALDAVFDGAAAARVQALRLDAQHAGADGETAPLPLALDDGRRLKVTLHRHDAVHTLLRLHVGPAAAAGASDPDALDRRLLGLFWDSPYPATVQDERFRLVAVNDAFVRFCGYARERLIGSDPLALMREPDRAGVLAGRASAAAVDDSAAEHCLVDAGGRERWYRVAGRWLRDEDGRRLHVAVLQDCSAERAALGAVGLDHWFDMSPVGMVLYDDAGVLVRTNPAFQALVG